MTLGDLSLDFTDRVTFSSNGVAHRTDCQTVLNKSLFPLLNTTGLTLQIIEFFTKSWDAHTCKQRINSQMDVFMHPKCIKGTVYPPQKKICHSLLTLSYLILC